MRKKLAFETLELRQLLAANPIITEFVADNDGLLDDGEGAAEDWIEIYNAGDQSVDLLGYRLTDDPADANKWQFSASEVLEPGEFLIVFASGNDAPDSAGNPHTNFSLSASGDYLALADPTGVVLSEFGPAGADYPAQTSGVSYGLAFNSTSSAVVTPESSVRYFMPSDGSVDATWTEHGFNDAAWQTGTASIGYETSGSNYADAGLLDTTVPPGTTSVYVRIPFSVAEPDQFLSTLQVKYDDAFIAYINDTRVAASPNAPLSGENYLSVAAFDHPDSQAEIYQNFDVSAFSNVLNVGANTLAIHLLNRPISSDLLLAPNMVLTSGGLIEPSIVGPLQSPTPGLPNTNLRASDVQFSHVGGALISSFPLTLTSADASESIRYTTDGTIPQSTSTLYTGPITVSLTTQIRARAFGTAGQVGSVATETYTLTDSTTGAFTSDLPIIVLENFGQGTPGTGDFEDAAFSLYEVDASTGRSALASDADLTSIIGQHRRGRSTAGNPKTNLRIELRDNNGEDQAHSLLGMPAESDWILYAPYNFDRALMRNTTFFEMSRQMGNWAPRTRFVEVYANYNDGQLNGNDYMGVYVLMENIKRDADRVDIAELTPTQNTEPNITGGYIIALDATDNETPPDGAWRTNRNIPTLGDSWLVHEEPDRTELSEAQVDYIRTYVQDFEDALYGPNSTDPLLGYQAYFDVDASIDHHIIRVLSKEPDGLRLSTFLTKDRDGKLAFGPIWDSDRSAGADNDSRSANPMGWFLPDVDFFESDWWGPLFDDPNFMQRWVDRWQELRATVLSDDNIQAMIDVQAEQLAEAQVRNFNEWPNIAPNGGQYADPGLFGWEGEVSHLANWLLIRANWMDEQLVQAPMFAPASGNVTAGQLVAITPDAPDVDVYYTLDGSDPRADGGGLSPTAILYAGPITVDQTTQVNARTFGSPSSTENSNSSYPVNESPSDGIDGNVFTKYLNFGKENSGIIVTPNVGASTVRSFRLTTANDAVSRDPSSWELYGTNDAIQSTDNSTGLAENWTLIDSGDLSLPFGRNSVGPLVTVSNSTAYASYKLMFPTVRSPSQANSMQVAEIEFFETTNGTGAQVLSGGAVALAVHVQQGQTSDGLSPWSRLVTGLFSVEVPADASSLRISELHYHPADPTPAELLVAPGTDEDDYEFIELLNVSDQTISLNGVTLSEAVDFDFSTGEITSLAPGETVLVVDNALAFAARYGGGFPIAGQYSGKFADGGERVVLTDGAGQVIHDFVYDDVAPWPVAADGDGPSLEAVDLLGDHGMATNWRASATVGGTPGSAGDAAAGDFDQDGDADGADFLAWQRGFSTQFDQQDLADWETGFGTQPPQIAALTSPFSPSSQASAADAELLDAAIALWRSSKSEVIDVEIALDDGDPFLPEARAIDAASKYVAPTLRHSTSLDAAFAEDDGAGTQDAEQTTPDPTTRPLRGAFRSDLRRGWK